MLSDIQNGQISDDLSYITQIDDNLLKYCIKNKSLIISKSGAPIKTAIATVSANEKILATGNLYVIELDEDKINPYFLKAFLDSDVGTALLKSLSVGSIIPNLPIDSIKKMIIPLPSIDVQNKIADKYLATIVEISALRLKIAEVEEHIKNIYSDDE